MPKTVDLPQVNLSRTPTPPDHLSESLTLKKSLSLPSPSNPNYLSLLYHCLHFGKNQNWTPPNSETVLQGTCQRSKSYHHFQIRQRGFLKLQVVLISSSHSSNHVYRYKSCWNHHNYWLWCNQKLHWSRAPLPCQFSSSTPQMTSQSLQCKWNHQLQGKYLMGNLCWSIVFELLRKCQTYGTKSWMKTSDLRNALALEMEPIDQLGHQHPDHFLNTSNEGCCISLWVSPLNNRLHCPTMISPSMVGVECGLKDLQKTQEMKGMAFRRNDWKDHHFHSDCPKCQDPGTHALRVMQILWGRLFQNHPQCPPPTTNLRSHHWPSTHIHPKNHQGILSQPPENKDLQSFHWRISENWTYHTLEISTSISFIFCPQKEWHFTFLSRLWLPGLPHHSKCRSPAPHPWTWEEDQ